MFPVKLFISLSLSLFIHSISVHIKGDPGKYHSGRLLLLLAVFMVHGSCCPPGQVVLIVSFFN